MTSLRLAPVLVAAVLLLAGCSGDGEPAPLPSTSASAVDATEQSTIDGEWTITRTVTESDDVDNPEHVVGTVSTRAVLFGDVSCSGGPCTGGVLSGTNTTTRASTTFTSSGNVIRYEFSGFLNCVRQDTMVVLVPDGFAYTATAELTAVATAADDDTAASTLEGTLTLVSNITDAAIEAGCTRDPLESTTMFSLSGVRTVAATAAPTT